MWQMFVYIKKKKLSSRKGNTSASCLWHLPTNKWQNGWEPLLAVRYRSLLALMQPTQLRSLHCSLLFKQWTATNRAGESNFNTFFLSDMEYYKLDKYHQLAFFASRPRNMSGQIRHLMYVCVDQTDSYLIKCFANFRLLYLGKVSLLLSLDNI